MENLDTKKLSSLIVPLITLLIVVGVGIFWTVPTVQNYVSSNEEIDSLKRQIDLELIPKQQTLEKADVNEIEKNTTIISRAIPTEANPPYILAHVESVAGSVGIDLQKAAFSDIVTNTTTQTVVISFGFTTTYDVVQKFMDQLSHEAPLIYVQSVAVEGLGVSVKDSEQVTDEDLFTVAMKISAPFSPPSVSELATGQSLQTTIDEYDSLLNEVNGLRYTSSLNDFNNQLYVSGKQNLFLNN